MFSNTRLIVTQEKINLIEQLIASYLIESDVNKRQDELYKILNLVHPQIGSRCASLVNPFIEKLQDMLQPNAPDPRIFSILAFLFRLKEDFAKAAEYLGQATALYDANALFLQGYLQMKGLIPSKELAIESFRKAADLGHIKAMTNLATLYIEKINAEDKQQCLQNLKLNKLARSLYFQAAILGDTLAQQNFNDFEKSRAIFPAPFNAQFTPLVPADTKNYFKRTLTITLVFDTTRYFISSLALVIYLPQKVMNLDKEMQSDYIKKLNKNLREIFTTHLKQHKQAFEKSPFKAEQLKISFDKNKATLVQQAIERWSQTLPVAQETNDSHPHM